MGVIALDVGGTTIKGAVVDRDTVLATRSFPTRRAAGPDAVVETVLDTAERLIAVADEQGMAVDAVGLAVLGLVDTRRGVATYSANAGWRDIPLRTLAEERLGIPVAFANDVNAAGHAEGTIGAAAGCSSALVVCIGTGIAAAVVHDGAVHVGATEQAGELGQTLVRAPGGAQMVRLESVASAAAITAAYEAASGPVSGLSATDVIAAAGHDDIARSIWSSALDRLGDVLATAVAVLDPERIVVGGGLSHAGEAVCEPLSAGVAARLAWRTPPPVVAARFGNRAGWIGAALYAWERLGDERGARGRWSRLDRTRVAR